MSNYGVELVNQYGYQIANMNDVNYVFRSSGQIANWQFGNHGDAYTGLSMITSGMNCPLVFFKPMAANQRITQRPGCNLLYPDIIGAGAYIGEDLKSIDVYKWWNIDMGTVQYYIFDRWVPPERSRYGIQIFDPSGAIIFDSGWKFLKLRQVTWLDPGYPNHAGNGNGANWTQVGSAGWGNLAVSMPHPRAYIIPTGSFGTMCGECVHLDGANNIFVSLLPTGNFLDMAPPQGWVDNVMRTQVMIADVDGLPTTYNPVEIRNA